MTEEQIITSTQQPDTLAQVVSALDAALPGISVTADNVVAVTLDVCRLLGQAERQRNALLAYLKG